MAAPSKPLSAPSGSANANPNATVEGSMVSPGLRARKIGGVSSVSTRPQIAPASSAACQKRQRLPAPITSTIASVGNASNVGWSQSARSARAGGRTIV